MDGGSEKIRIRRAGESSIDRASLRPIRALLRGLQCLTILNTRDGATVTDVATATRLPRTTAHRVLETLCDGGYVVRDPADERYRTTILVRALSDGFGDQSWVRQVAKPVVNALGRRVLYPVHVTTPGGLSMVVRETTDRESPLAIERQPAGTKLPLHACACGRLYLALCPPAHRNALVDILGRTGIRADALLRSRGDLERDIELIVQQGFSQHQQSGSREASVAVPIRVEDQVLGFLSMRYIASALTLKEVVSTYLPQLIEAAGRIAMAVPDDRGSIGEPAFAGA